MRNTFYPVCRVWRGGAGGEGRYLESVWSRASRAKCRQAALTLVKLPDMVSHDVIIISTDVTTSLHPTKPSNCLIQTCGEWETSVTILLRLAPAPHRGTVAPWHCIHEWPVSPESESGTRQQVWVEAVASPPTILILFQPIIMDLTMRGCCYPPQQSHHKLKLLIQRTAAKLNYPFIKS